MARYIAKNMAAGVVDEVLVQLAYANGQGGARECLCQYLWTQACVAERRRDSRKIKRVFRSGSLRPLSASPSASRCTLRRQVKAVDGPQERGGEEKLLLLLPRDEEYPIVNPFTWENWDPGGETERRPDFKQTPVLLKDIYGRRNPSMKTRCPIRGVQFHDNRRGDANDGR